MQCFPEHVGQKADQDIGLYAFWFLVPHRTNLEIGFLNVEGVLGFGQLDVGPLQFFRTPVDDITVHLVPRQLQTVTLASKLRSFG
jgi:hypothetical protein